MFKKIQGDVIIKKIDKLPEGLTFCDTKVLQESEVTGHHHHFHPEADVEVWQMESEPTEQLTITPDFGKFIVVREPTKLYHGKGFKEDPAKDRSGDHKALSIEPGVYKIDITREYDYNLNETTRVVD